VSQRESGTRRISLDLSEARLAQLDSLKAEYGLRSRGAILEQLLSQLFDLDEEDGDSPSDPIVSDGDGTPSSGADQRSAHGNGLNEQTAIVLIHSDLVSQRDLEGVQSETDSTDDWGLAAGMDDRPRHSGGTDHRSRTRAAGERSSGIQLPGFVQRQSHELKRSLHPPRPAAEADRSLALITAMELQAALEAARLHWLEIYNQDPSEQVLEAAMIWLGRDIWPQSDQSDGRPFTWSLTQQVVASVAPDWHQAEANFERVIAAAGILEDPFSGATLALRVPTLITRFVQRVRTRQKRNASFQAIDQTMTVHAALKLLQLPTVADRPYSLPEIREAYREQAMNHHPDAGGSAEAMRRLNEAYQFLKERYRQRD